MYDRLDKVAALLSELAATFIQNEALSSPLITVTRVTASADLAHATVFVTVFPEGDEERALIFLKRKGTDLRHFISEKTRIKKVPFFDFAIDVGEKNRQHIDEIVA